MEFNFPFNKEGQQVSSLNFDSSLLLDDHSTLLENFSNTSFGFLDMEMPSMDFGGSLDAYASCAYFLDLMDHILILSHRPP